MSYYDIPKDIWPILLAEGSPRSGFTTKIHAVVDALGNLIRFTLTGGEKSDFTEVHNLLKNFKNLTVIAAGAATAIIDELQARGGPVEYSLQALPAPAENTRLESL